MRGQLRETCIAFPETQENKPFGEWGGVQVTSLSLMTLLLAGVLTQRQGLLWRLQEEKIVEGQTL